MTIPLTFPEAFQFAIQLRYCRQSVFQALSFPVHLAFTGPARLIRQHVLE